MTASEDRRNSINYINRSYYSILIDYLTGSSTHGLRGIGVADNTPNRIFWTIVFVTAFTLMSFFIASSVSQYLQYPTDVDIQTQVQYNMIFPAVTICSATPYRADKINASLLEYAEQHGINQTDLDLETLLRPLIIEYYNSNRFQELVGFGFELSDMLIECSYNGIDCSSHFVRSFSSIFGNCYTFNWKSSMNDLYTLRNLSSTLILLEGLSMKFYVPQELFFPASYFDSGLIIEVHNNDEFPLIVQNGLGLKPGLSHIIRFSKSHTTLLPTPYTNCTSSIHDDLLALYETTFGVRYSHSVTYSQSACLTLCQQAFVFAYCKCVLPYPFYINKVWSIKDKNLTSANACVPNSSSEKCALQARRQLEADITILAKWCYYCTPQCTLTDFLTVPSFLAAPSRKQKDTLVRTLLNNTSNLTKIALPSDFATNYDHYLDRNYLQVLVSCRSEYVTVYSQKAKQSAVDTFSAVGGQTGIWIGLSVVGVIEFGQFLIRLLINCNMWRKRRRIRMDEPDIVNKARF